MNRAVKSILIALALIATAVSIFVLGFSFRPDPPKRGALPRIDIADVPPNSVRVVDTDSLRYFVLRLSNNEAQAIAAPLHQGMVPMPDGFWWKPFYDCRNFGIDTSNDQIVSGATFHCRDATTPQAWRDSWHWNTNGRNAPRANAKSVEHMYRVRIERDGDELIFIGLEAD